MDHHHSGGHASRLACRTNGRSRGGEMAALAQAASQDPQWLIAYAIGSIFTCLLGTVVVFMIGPWEDE